MGNKPTIFVSYNHNQADYANKIVQEVSFAANIVIDKNLSPWSNLTEFMESIREQDFAVLLISDLYLKSQNCMFEASQLMRDKNWLDKVMFIVFEDADVYDVYRHEKYIRYWQSKREKLDKQINQISQTSTQSIAGMVDAAREIDEIQRNISSLLAEIRRAKNPTLEDGISAILHRVTEFSFDDCDSIQILLERSINKLATMTGANYNQIILSAKTSPHHIGLVVFADKILGNKQRYRLVEQSGLIANCYATGTRLNCGNISECNDYFMAVIETESELVIPIFCNGRIIGVFNSESEFSDFYKDETVAVIESMLSSFAKRLIELGYRSNCHYQQLPYVTIT